jgi:hypothetical protein
MSFLTVVQVLAATTTHPHTPLQPTLPWQMLVLGRTT